MEDECGQFDKIAIGPSKNRYQLIVQVFPKKRKMRAFLNLKKHFNLIWSPMLQFKVTTYFMSQVLKRLLKV